METPIQNGGFLEFYLIVDEDPSLLSREDVLPHVNQLVSALSEDDSVEFLRVAKDRVELAYEGRTSYVIAPSLLLRWAIYHRALECTKVLLQSNGADELRATTNTRACEMPPFHQATAELLPDFVELFLKRGAPVFIGSTYVGSDFFDMLPLNIAVQKLSEKILWTPTQSVYRLFFTLCGTMELDQGFRTISQLMRPASVEQNREAIYHYAREGKIVELAIFLYVDAISEFGIFKNFSNDEYLSLRQSLATNSKEEIRYVVDPTFKNLSHEQYLALRQPVETNSSSHSKEEIRYVVDGNGVIESMGEKHLMMSLLLLLQIFYQTNFSLLGFTATCEIVAKRIKDAGFDWNSGDMQNLGNNVAATEVKHQKMCGVPPRCSFNILPIGAQLSRPRSNSPWCFPEKRGISSAAQTFQALEWFGSRLMPTLFTQKNTRPGAGKAISHGGPPGLSSSLRKMWPIFSVAIKRRIG